MKHAKIAPSVPVLELYEIRLVYRLEKHRKLGFLIKIDVMVVELKVNIFFNSTSLTKQSKPPRVQFFFLHTWQRPVSTATTITSECPSMERFSYFMLIGCLLENRSMSIFFFP